MTKIPENKRGGGFTSVLLANEGCLLCFEGKGLSSFRLQKPQKMASANLLGRAGLGVTVVGMISLMCLARSFSQPASTLHCF